MSPITSHTPTASSAVGATKLGPPGERINVFYCVAQSVDELIDAHRTFRMANALAKSSSARSVADGRSGLSLEERITLLSDESTLGMGFSSFMLMLHDGAHSETKYLHASKRAYGWMVNFLLMACIFVCCLSIYTTIELI